MINQFDELKPLEMIALKNKDRKADVTFFVRGGWSAEVEQMHAPYQLVQLPSS